MAGILKVDQLQSDSNLALKIASANVAFVDSSGLRVVGSNLSVAGTSVISSGKVPTTVMPAGTVLQVVQATKTDTWSTSGFTYADITGLSVTITPTSVSSKFLVMTNVNASSNYWKVYMNVVRNGTTLGLGDALSIRNRSTATFAQNASDMNAHGFILPLNVTLLDSPNTTSTLTYKLQGAGRSNDGTWVMYVNRSVPDRDVGEYDDRMASRLVVMEIAG